METIDNIVDFKPNSELSTSTNIFGILGRKEQVISTDVNDTKGKMYTVHYCSPRGCDHCTGAVPGT